MEYVKDKIYKARLIDGSVVDAVFTGGIGLNPEFKAVNPLSDGSKMLLAVDFKPSDIWECTILSEAEAEVEVAQENGGPAFPSHGSMGEVVCEGMTLRDYFAGQALIGICASPAESINHLAQVKGVTVGQLISKQCYGHADAMLAAREVQS